MASGLFGDRTSETPMKIWVNIDSGNGLLFDSTKPLPEPMFINHQWGLLAFTGDVQYIYAWDEFENY